MGNLSCYNPQPLKQPQAIQPEQNQPNSVLLAGIDYITFLHQQVQNKFFTEFNKQKGIQKYVAIPLQNLSQLYHFVQSIKRYESNFQKLSQNQKKPHELIIQKECQTFVDEVKSILFDLKKNTKKNVKTLKINESKNVKNHIGIPYFLPWITSKENPVCIYIGQWQYQNYYLQKNFPFGVGRLYLSNQVWQGQIECSLEEFQKKDLDQIQKMKEKINKIQVPIKDKLSLLKTNLKIYLQGLGRKFTKDEEYCGYFQKGILNGKGQYKNYKLEYSYQGTWLDGTKSGKGIQKTKLTHYEGQFHNNKKNGQGTLIFYISMQQERQRQSQQKKFDQISPNQPQYKQRKQRVKIQMTLEEKADALIRKVLQSQIPNYKGEDMLMLTNKRYNSWQLQQFPFINQDFVFNLKFQQSMKTNFVQKYIGEFRNDLFEGKGTYQWSKGNFYVGDWVEGKMQGEGKFFWKEGYSYYGQYKNDLKHGKGQMKWDPYKRHRGSWAFGKKHGYGEEIKIQIRNDILGISIKSGLWKNNYINQRDVYFEKFFPIVEDSPEFTLFFTSIQSYYTNLRLSQKLRRKLFDEKTKKYYRNPCQLCGNYFLKVQQNQTYDDIGKVIFNLNMQDQIQPEICKQCEKKLLNSQEIQNQQKE